MSSSPLQLTRQNIIANIITLLSGSAAAQGLTALALLLTARQLGAVKYGQYTATYTLTSFCAILFNLGLDLWLLHQAGRTPQHLAKLTGSILAIKYSLGLAWIVLLYVLVSILDLSLFPAQMIRMSAIAVWLDSLLSTNLTVFRAALNNKYSSILESSTDALWLLFTLFLVASRVMNPLVYLSARAGALFVGNLVTTVFIWQKVHPEVSIYFIKQALSETFPFLTSEFLGWASLRQDILIVALLLGEKATGLYSPAVSVINAAFLLPAAIYLVITPVLSHLFVLNPRQAWLTAKRSILLSVVTGLGASLGFAIIAGPVVSLLGATFRGSYEVLRILSIILSPHTIAFTMAAILVATRQQPQRVRVQAIVVVLNAILNFVVVPWAGIRGAAVVYVITDTLLMAGYSYLVWRYYIRMEW